jgi:hypothetical protein
MESAGKQDRTVSALAAAPARLGPAFTSHPHGKLPLRASFFVTTPKARVQLGESRRICFNGTPRVLHCNERVRAHRNFE